jgi:uncharacterized protein YbbC (DUF1343 family)
VGAALVPVRHGLTLGELARWMNARDDIGADLRVVAMDGWRRGMWFDEGGLPWVPPSPNISSLAACVAYTATCLIEGTTVSEGRGTTQPFEVIGAPWVDADTLAARLNALRLPGVRCRPRWFRPATSKHAGQRCGGVQLHVIDRIAFAGVRTGLHLLATLRSLYPEQVTWVRGESGSDVVDLLLGTDAPRRAIEHGDDVDVVVALWQSAIEVFKAERGPFLLYDE